MAGEGNRSRNKGRSGEAEVAAIWRGYGLDARGLEGRGDHTIVGGSHEVRLHSEVKRCETARPWAWMAQAEREAPAGAVPVVSFRKSRSKWYAILPLEDLARLLA